MKNFLFSFWITFVSFILLSASVNAQAALTGMCLIVEQNKSGEYNGLGTIRRIDIDNGSVIAEDAIISDHNDCICPRFSPDGTRIAYIAGNGSELVICNIDGSNKLRVNTKASVSGGQTVSWTKNYIWVFRGMWKKSDKIDKHNPATGSFIETVTLPQQMIQCYVSADETVAAGTKDGLGIGFITDFATGSMDYTGVDGGCSAGPNPNGTMICGNLWEGCGHHQSMNIWNIDKNNKTYSKQGYYDIDGGCGGKTILDLNDNFIWNHQMWAGHCNVVVLPCGENINDQLRGNQFPWVYDVDGDKWQKCYTGQDNRNVVWHPYDFYQDKLPGPAEAYLSIEQNQIAFSVNEDGSNPSPVSTELTITNGGDGTLGDISVSTKPDWVSASLSGSGNTQHITLSVNSSAVSSLNPQVYSDNVLLYAPVTGAPNKSTNGVIQVQLSVIGKPELTQIKINPSSATVLPEHQFNYQAICLDQYGDTMTGISLTWSVDCQSTLGSIDGSTGMFTAGAVTGGPYTVTAGANGISDAAQITVTDIWLKINCGTNVAVNGWENDENYLAGGSDYNWTSPPVYSTGTRMAPEEIYSSVVHSPNTSHTYNIPANKLPNGIYKLRLHGSDHFGNRGMIYVADGDTVLQEFSWDDSLGGLDIAGYVETNIEVKDGDGLTLQCHSGSGNDVFEAGFEIIATYEMPDFLLLSPAGGESFYVDDSLHVTWTGDDQALQDQIDVMVFMCLSPFEKYQISWADNIPDTDFNKIPGDRKEWKWHIPAKIYDAESGDSITIAGKEVYLKIENYNELDITTKSDPFWIDYTSGIGSPKCPQLSIHPNPTHGIVIIKAGGMELFSGNVQVFQVTGKQVPVNCTFNKSNAIIDFTGYPNGIYILKVGNKLVKVVKQ